MSSKLSKYILSGVAVAAAGAAGLTASSTASAHHSFAQFQMDKEITISGTVRKFEWTNPHSWLWVVVDDGKGGTQVWGFEGTAPGELTRSGWNKNSVLPGDKVTVSTHPLKDGRPGGTLGKVVKADGSLVGGAAPGPVPGAPPPGAGAPPAGAPPVAAK